MRISAHLNDLHKAAMSWASWAKSVELASAYMNQIDDELADRLKAIDQRDDRTLAQKRDDRALLAKKDEQCKLLEINRQLADEALEQLKIAARKLTESELRENRCGS